MCLLLAVYPDFWEESSLCPRLCSNSWAQPSASFSLSVKTQANSTVPGKSLALQDGQATLSLNCLLTNKMLAYGCTFLRGWSPRGMALKVSSWGWEIAQRLGAQAVLSEEPSLIPSNHIDSPGDPTPSSSLYGHCIHMVCRHTCREHTHT